MPITWKISANERLVLARAEGPVTLKDIENYLDAIVMSDAQPYAKLFDAGTMVLQLSDDELMLLGARMSAYGSAFAAGPLAFVATTLAVEGFAKRFLNVAGSVQRPSKLCKTVDEAKAWLRSQNNR